MLDKMLAVMCVQHQGQFDKSGKPYALHPLAVMKILNSDDEELNCIALGHDLIEDTEMSYEQIKLNFGERVAEGIWLLTKTPSLSYERYKENVFSSEDAMRVKLADLTHNMDPTRLKGVRKKDLDRMARYQEFYFEIKERLND